MELMQEKEFSFPFVKDYLDKNQLSTIFPKLLKINNPSYINNNNIDTAYFVILKSTNDDDLHKAIKYGIWTSSNSDNRNLSNLWKESNKNGKNIPIYLIYQVESSPFFMGIAKMISDFDKAKSFKYWWEPCKWFGLFKIEWIFIKDVHYKLLQLIKYQIKSGTDISFEKGMEILEIFQNYPLNKSIFDCFPFYDQRENIIREERDNDLLFKKTFDDLSKTYSCDPELLLDRPVKYLGKNNNYRPEYDNQHKYYNQYDEKNYYYSDNNNNVRNINHFKKKPFFKIKEFYPTNDPNFSFNILDQSNQNEKEKNLNEEKKINTVINKFENNEIKTNENNKELFNETKKEKDIENKEIKINEINNELINESLCENNKEQNEKHANFSENNLEKKNHKTYQKTPYLKNSYNGYNGKNKNYSYKKPSQNNYEIVYIPKEEK